MSKPKSKKKIRRAMLIAAGSAVFFGTFSALSLGLAMYIMRGRRQTLDEEMQWQSEHYDTSFYEPLEKKDYTVKSFDGYEMYVQLLKNPKPTDKYVIITHGHTGNRYGSLKYVKLYLELGYNCIIYDLRDHGVNGRSFCTYGIREGHDLAELVKDTRWRYPELSQLGLHGESLGAASTAASMKYKPEVDFAVADCGFADILNVLRGAAKHGHMPSFFVDIANIGARVRFRYNFLDMRPIDSLEGCRVPFLFIHGAADDFILPDNSRRMAERLGGNSEVRLIEGAGHAESVLTDPKSYRRILKAFLAKEKLI